MIIGVDAGALSITDDRLKVGVYRVTKNALAALAALDTVNNYRLYTFGTIEEGILSAFKGRAEQVRLPKFAWHRVWLPLELAKHPVDAFLGFAQSLPSVHTLCDIGFIYDLGFLHEPEAYGKNAGVLIKQTDSLVSRADHIITISQATKADIVDHYGKIQDGSRVKPGMTGITVAYPGIDASFSPAGEKFNSGRPYFLFVGSLNKAKDIPTLLESFAKFLEIKLDPRLPFQGKRGDDKQGLGDDNIYDLYLVGGNYWPDGAIEETIKKLHLAGRVKMLGYMADEKLVPYYRGATAFVTTALREGFCLPAAEAMACGTPVVALDRGALREVVGEGGMIVSQKSGFSEAMEKMLEKKTRVEFSKKALEQAKKYKWEKFAKIVLDRINKRHE